jgi:hypothetical protein
MIECTGGIMVLDGAEILGKVRNLFKEEQAYKFRVISVSREDSDWKVRCSFFSSLLAEKEDTFEVTLDVDGNLKGLKRVE